MKKLLSFLFSLVLSVSLLSAAVAASNIPEEYIGKWAGESGDIRLIFEISGDGRARFTFEQGSYSESNDVALSVDNDTFTVELPADDKITESCGGSYSYADGILTVNVETVFVGGRVFSYSVPCERVVAAGAASGAFPVECEVYGQPYVYSGYRIEMDEDGNALIKIQGNGIVFLKGPDGKNVSPISAVVVADGKEAALMVDSVTLLATGAIRELSTKPIEHELVFKLSASAVPEYIALLNTETGETIASFNVVDEPQM